MFYPLLSSSEVAGVPEDSNFPLFGSVNLILTLASKWGWDTISVLMPTNVCNKCLVPITWMCSLISNEIFKLENVFGTTWFRFKMIWMWLQTLLHMIHVSSSGSRSKSLSSWPFGFSIFTSFVKYDQNNNFVAFIFSASIWKFGMKLESKHVCPHPLWIISFLL